MPDKKQTKRSNAKTPPIRHVSKEEIFGAKIGLDLARKAGDSLQISLAESVLNDYLDAFQSQLSRLSRITSGGKNE